MTREAFTARRDRETIGAIRLALAAGAKPSRVCAIVRDLVDECPPTDPDDKASVNRFLRVVRTRNTEEGA